MIIDLPNGTAKAAEQLLFKTDAAAKFGQAIAQHYAALSTAIVKDAHSVRG